MIVRCEDDGEVLSILVTDTGVGIAGEMLEVTFAPFVQVRAELTRTVERVAGIAAGSNRRSGAAHSGQPVWLLRHGGAATRDAELRIVPSADRLHAVPLLGGFTHQSAPPRLRRRSNAEEESHALRLLPYHDAPLIVWRARSVDDV